MQNAIGPPVCLQDAAFGLTPILCTVSIMCLGGITSLDAWLNIDNVTYICAPSDDEATLNVYLRRLLQHTYFIHPDEKFARALDR